MLLCFANRRLFLLPFYPLGRVPRMGLLGAPVPCRSFHAISIWNPYPTVVATAIVETLLCFLPMTVCSCDHFVRVVFGPATCPVILKKRAPPIRYSTLGTRTPFKEFLPLVCEGGKECSQI